MKNYILKVDEGVRNVGYMKKVSIITPLYNCRNFIELTVNSVLCQTHKDWELIIIDDKSTDGSNEIAEKISQIDERILFYKNHINIGAAETRNNAIKKATGRFIAFLDADDIWLPNKLEKQLKFMEINNIGFCFSNYKTMDEDGNYLSDVITPKKVSLKDMYSHNYIGCLTAIYDTSFFGKFYMPDIRKRQDYALWLTMLNKFDYAYSLQESLAFYRIRTESLSKNKIDAVKYYWKILRDIGKLSPLLSGYYTIKYIALTAMKKHLPKIYNSIVKF
jgi:teichuronic acid biosynthesis glycosyltransferase TuaG